MFFDEYEQLHRKLWFCNTLKIILNNLVILLMVLDVFVGGIRMDKKN
jgi:hypothetical protein